MAYRTTSTFEYAAMKFGGEGALDQWLLVEREHGTSYDVIALLLEARTEISVNGSTIRLWCIRRDLG